MLFIVIVIVIVVVVVIIIIIVIVIVVLGGSCGPGQFNSATGCSPVPAGLFFPVPTPIVFAHAQILFLLVTESYF